MMPYEPVLDIMRRTMANLKYIEAHATPNGPFEVTQLINSCLGALAHPYENWKPELNSKPLKDAVRIGWPSLEKEHARDRDPRSLGEALSWLRNGIAHGNLTYLPSGRGEIQAIRIVNCEPRNGLRTWGTILTPEDLRRFLACFSELVEGLAVDTSTHRKRI